MGEDEEKIRELLGKITPKAPSAADFGATPSLKDVLSAAQAAQLAQQKHEQRGEILTFIEKMAKWSLVFLVCIILFQMAARIYFPSYNGVSDRVISIITAGVFGQVIGIIATIATRVWRDPN